MNLIANIQKQYEQLWKYIIRPSRSPYHESKLGSVIFRYQGHEAQRKDFCLTNSRGYQFQCSLWLPSKLQRANVVIYLHGNSSNRLEGIEYLGKLISQGIGLCTFDFSGSGNAEGEYISLGFYEQQDLRMVVQQLKVYPKIERIALWGRSMGAVTALLYLPQDNCVSSVVLDSPFKSLKGLIEDAAAKSSKVPGFVLSAAFKVIEGTIKTKAKFSIYHLDPLKLGAPKIFIPAYFIVGVKDEIIPIEHTGELFEAYGGEDKIIKMVNGGHNDDRPAMVIDSVIEFLKERFVEEQKCQKICSSTVASKQEDKQQSAPEVQTEEIVQIQKAIKTGSFSWSKLFSVFSRDKKSPEKSIEKSAEKQIEKKLQSSQTSTVSLKEKPKKKKSQEKQKQKKSGKYEVPLQQKIRQYSYCFM